MNSTSKQVDVVIVGASVAGCTAAIFYAKKGLRVALIERNPNIDAYKKVCTHYLQSAAVPTIKRLGLEKEVEAAGGVRNSIDTWTRWGWVRPAANNRFYGYNIRRQTFDPMLRRKAASTPNVELMLGTTLRELTVDNSRVTGVKVEQNKQHVNIQARLVVGADGRNSRTAKLAGVSEKKTANNRFVYFAYYRNLTLSSGRRSQMWLLEPGVAYAMPNDDGTTLLAVMLPKTELATFKQDIESNFEGFINNLPEGPDLRNAKRTSDVMGMVDMPNIARAQVGPGVALVGDAALASDPLWGNGCSWAFQSARWLTDATTKALLTGSDEDVQQALEKYRHQHHARLSKQANRFAEFSSARPLNVVERVLYAAAALDSKFTHHTGAYPLRLNKDFHLPPVKVLSRALWLTLTNRVSAAKPASKQQPQKTRTVSNVYRHQGI